MCLVKILEKWLPFLNGGTIISITGMNVAISNIITDACTF